MIIRKGLLSTSGRAVALATVAAFALTTFDAPKVQAAEIRAPQAQAVKVADKGEVTDFSSRRRYRGGNPAAAIAAFGLVAGTIAAVAAADRHRDYYYAPGPAYYDGGYGGYGYAPAPTYYGPGYGYGGYHGGYAPSNSRAYRQQFGGN